MTHIPFTRSRFAALLAPALVASAALLLAGCAAPGAGLPDSAHKATLELDGQSYTFAPASCVTDEGYPMVSGPGVDHTTDQPVFLDMDIAEVDGWPAGKAYIYYDSENGAPSDTYLIGEAGSGDDYSMGHMKDGFEVELLMRNHDGAVAGTGTFTVNCG